MRFIKIILNILTVCSYFGNAKEYDNHIIRGINWFGFETEYENLMCIWAHDIDWHMAKMKEIGFNYIRLPFSLEFIQKNKWEKMDLFFEKAQEYNISVALDFHRLHNSFQSSKPYDEDYSFDEFLYGWRKIISRYENYSVLRAIDIFNEFQSSNYVEWNNLSRQIVSFLEESFPNRFIFFVGGVSWGGDIHYMDLEDLPYSDRIWYSIHKYWFSDRNPYTQKWDYSFGNHKPIVNVGEWGYKSDVSSEVAWANQFVNYLLAKGIRDTFFWTWSYNSGDTGGILRNDCTTIDMNKVHLLERLWDTPGPLVWDDEVPLDDDGPVQNDKDKE